MRQWKTFLGFVFTVLFVPVALAQSPVGTWTTIDEKTGKKRAIVRLSVSGGTLSGIIEKVYSQPGDTGICGKCPGSFKNKPIQGLRFIWGLNDKGNGRWEGGKILDPKSGKIYRARITLQGNKLFVRGYVGFSVLGRTQLWVR
jgi:uncharacterized protein (DUF2147 family)